MLLPSEYEEHLATQPDEVRAMLQSHIRGGPDGPVPPSVGGVGHAAPTRQLRSRRACDSRQNWHRLHRRSTEPCSRPPLPDEHN